ncbi:MAG: sigma-70 family RNA polymerase sigma factor [Longimicrobiales bacterium]
MGSDPRHTVTSLLEAVSSGTIPPQLPEALLPLVYEELRRLAAGYLGREGAAPTLQATEPVHEAYLKLVDQRRVAWAGKTHFFAVAATAMRRILVDNARRRARLKRGGRDQPVTLHDDLGLFPSQGLEPEDLIVLDEALAALGEYDERQAKIVEMRVFSGLTVEEVAGVLGVSRRTVEGEWTHAKAWLRRLMAGGGPRE